MASVTCRTSGRPLRVASIAETGAKRGGTAGARSRPGTGRLHALAAVSRIPPAHSTRRRCVRAAHSCGRRGHRPWREGAWHGSYASDRMKGGLSKAPHRSLLKADGLTDEEISRPLVAVVNSANEIIPGHLMLDKIAEAVKAGIRMAGGTPLEISTIGVCDGIAMNHAGMRYSLAEPRGHRRLGRDRRLARTRSTRWC